MVTGLWKSMSMFGFGLCLARSDEGRPRTRQKGASGKAYAALSTASMERSLLQKRASNALALSPRAWCRGFFLPIRQPRPWMRR